MAILSPIPPRLLKDAFLAAGYMIVDQDEYNWAFAQGDDDEPFIVPKKGRQISMEIMEKAQHYAKGSGLQQAILTKVQDYVRAGL